MYLVTVVMVARKSLGVRDLSALPGKKDLFEEVTFNLSLEKQKEVGQVAKGRGGCIWSCRSCRFEGPLLGRGSPC